MAANFLSSNSPYTFVWHDQAGQAIPAQTAQVKASVSTAGLTINIPADTIVSEPVILLNSAAQSNKSQNIINIGQNSQVQIIEYLMSDDNGSNNIVGTDINCATGVQLKHCVLQHASQNSSIAQQSTTHIYQATDSKVTSNIFSFGGGLSRIELVIKLQGANAQCEASCLAYTIDSETQNVLLQIDHEHEYCTSKSISRGILKGKSITDFIGRIMVHPGAKKTSADLQIKNLLCSPSAQATNKPELEIYNDDVRCSHGSTTGQLDAQALFYMRSRGIDEQTAISMLIAGFVQPVIDCCTIPMIAEYISNIIAER